MKQGLIGTFIILSLFQSWMALANFGQNIKVKKTRQNSFSETQPKELKNKLTCVQKCVQNCSIEQTLKDLGIKCFLKCNKNCQKKKETNSKKTVISDDLNTFKNELPQNYCLNGKNKETLTNKEILFEFAKGKCSPVIIAPGFLGSKIVVRINCEKLRSENAEIFSSCGWNACVSSDGDFTIKIPQKEYLILLPETLSPMNIMNLSSKTNLCFANLLKTEIDIRRNNEDLTRPINGVSFSIKGLLKNRPENSKCGSDAIRDLQPFTKQTVQSRAFSTMLIQLEYLGYVSGLSYQAIPYNSIYSYRENEFRLNFYNNLLRLKRLTGKKTTLIGFDNGNNNILYNLKFLEKKEKQTLIFNWVSIGGLFLGTGEFQKSLTMGKNWLKEILEKNSLVFKASAILNTNLVSTYEQMGIDGYKLFQNEEWFQKVKQRIEYEQNWIDVPYKNSGILFWPGMNENCYKKNSKELLSEKCSIGFYDTSQTDFLTIKHDSYKLEDTENLLKNYSLIETQKDLISFFLKKDYLNVRPQIPVVLIFGLKTEIKNYEYFSKDRFEKTRKGKFSSATSFTKAKGDGLVPSHSGLFLPLKWALDVNREFEAGIRDDPVLFLEVCSENNRLREIYDEKPSTGENKITRNRYNGLRCKCQFGDRGYGDCGHFGMLEESGVVEAVLQVVDSNQQADQSQFEVIGKMSEEYLEMELKYCWHLTDLKK